MSVERNRAAMDRAVDNFSIARLDKYLELYHPDSILHSLLRGFRRGARARACSIRAFSPRYRMRGCVWKDAYQREIRLPGLYRRMGLAVALNQTQLTGGRE